MLLLFFEVVQSIIELFTYNVTPPQALRYKHYVEVPKIKQRRRTLGDVLDVECWSTAALSTQGMEIIEGSLLDLKLVQRYRG